MERIESLDGSHFSGRSRRKKSKRSKQLKARTFSSVVQEAGREESLDFDLEEHADHRENLGELLDEVHESGEILLESQSLENIKKYRQAVQTFLQYVVDKMLAVEQRTSGSNILRRKRFTQITIIDGKLQRLVTGVLQNQTKQLDLLEKINEINGLLVDLIT
jgi:uncharacterized protein YaaR (DUF327 family)